MTKRQGELADDLRVPLFFEGLDFFFEGFGGVLGGDWAGFLEDDFAGIAAFVDVVDGHAGFGFVGGKDGFVDALAKEVFT